MMADDEPAAAVALATKTIDPQVLLAISGFVNTEARAVERWAASLTAALADDLKESSADDQWDAVLAILNHCGVLSRVFWPSSLRRCTRACCLDRETPEEQAAAAAAKHRGKALRKLFLPRPNRSAFNPGSRDPRNAVEHWDSKLDDKGWYADSIGKAIWGIWIGPASELPADVYPLRFFDPESYTVRVGRYDDLPIRPLIAEGAQVYERFCRIIPALKAAAGLGGCSDRTTGALAPGVT